MVLCWRSVYASNSITNRSIYVTVYATLLEVYTLGEILELNDKTEEECLEFLVEEGYVILPKIKPLEFDE